MISIDEITNGKVLEIKEYFKSICTRTGRASFKLHNGAVESRNEIAILVDSILKTYSIGFHTFKYIVDNDIQEISTECPVCGKRIDLSKRFSFTCGDSKCAARNPQRAEKQKKTNMERYGVAHTFQAEGVKKKIKESVREHYGVDYSWQAAEVKAKIQQTNIERYGHPNAMQSEEVNQRAIDTIRKRYGVDHQMHLDSVKEKIRRTCQERYGVNNPYQSEEVKGSIRESYIEKYGVEYPSQVPSIREKIRQVCVEKYGCEYSLQSREVREMARSTILVRYREENREKYLEHLRLYNLEQLSSEEEYNSSETLRFRCTKCGTEFDEYVYCNYRHLRCPNCHVDISLPEREVYEYVVSLLGKDSVQRNYRKILPNHRELDIYIPDKKLAIEFDGIYWHSASKKDPTYHVEKTLYCIEKGIRLIHIIENEWKYKKDLVKSIIKSALGIYDKVIYARKCSVMPVENQLYMRFLNENHLQGYVAASTKIGLYYNGELVACIGLGKSRFKKGEIEVLRFCTKKGFVVVGGLSKLIKHSGVDSLVSYIDLRYFTGNGYSKAGFRFISRSDPSYIYVRDGIVLSRFQCQKHKLPELLGDGFIPELTEEDNMEANGFTRIYDCGTLKYEWCKL